MIKMLPGAVSVLLCSAFSASSSSPAFDITVSAGPLERKNVPVRVQLHPGQFGDARVTPSLSRCRTAPPSPRNGQGPV